MLKRLRDDDALEQGGQGIGLQPLLRRYLIRNTKSLNERRYFFINKVGAEYHETPFEKLEDLRNKVREAPLLPFSGPDALFYLELRELIEETIEDVAAGNRPPHVHHDRPAAGPLVLPPDQEFGAAWSRP